MKICFVGHKFHLKSRSNVFFLDILRQMGSVTELYYSPDDADGETVQDLAHRVLETRYDTYVFWQTEEVAAELTAYPQIRRMILVPMWDGAVDRSWSWWQRFQGHQFISFSRALHETLQRAGLASVYFQYFPMPAARRVDTVRAPGAFFWERRPAEPLNAMQVYHQCKLLDIGHLHVHAVPDFKRDRTEQRVRLAQLGAGDVALTVSEWFKTREEFEACIAEQTLFFAPRQLEGIGMSFLEAMARGQVVVAPDAPTMNEYIGHMTSGILYDPKKPLDLPVLGPDDIRRLSDVAYSRACRGHQIWLDDRERLESVILNDGKRWSVTDSAATYVNLLRREAHRRAIEFSLRK